MDARSFVFGAVTGAFVAAVTSLVFRSNFNSPTVPQLEAAVNREPSSGPTGPAPPRDPENPAQSDFNDSGAEIRSMPGTSPPEGTSPEPGVNRQPENLTPRQLERIWNAESRDESWAAAAEISVGDFLARQPQPNALGEPSIDCRATLCRVLTSVDLAVHQAVPTTDLQAAMHTLQQESLGAELVWLGLEMLSDPAQPNQVIEAAYLRRIEPSGEFPP